MDPVVKVHQTMYETSQAHTLHGKLARRVGVVLLAGLADGIGLCAGVLAEQLTVIICSTFTQFAFLY